MTTKLSNTGVAFLARRHDRSQDHLEDQRRRKSFLKVHFPQQVNQLAVLNDALPDSDLQFSGVESRK